MADSRAKCKWTPVVYSVLMHKAIGVDYKSRWYVLGAINLWICTSFILTMPNTDWSQLRPISQLRIQLLKYVLSQVSVHLLDRIRFPEQPGSVGLIVPGSDPATSSHKAIVLANALANVLDDDSHIVQALVDEPDVQNLHDLALLYSKENLLELLKRGIATNRTNSVASGRRPHFFSYYSCGVRGLGTTSIACGSSTSSAQHLSCQAVCLAKASLSKMQTQHWHKKFGEA